MNTGDIFFHYDVSPTTWFYLSALMVIGIYFKFYRALSVRNMDLLSILLFGPCILLIMHGSLPDSNGTISAASVYLVRTGYVILFLLTLFYIIRLLLDCLMVRRPLLEPNLDSSGLRFTCLALLVFLAGSIAISLSPLEIRDLKENSAEVDHFIKHPISLEDALRINQLNRSKSESERLTQRGPGYPWFHKFALTPLAQKASAQADKTLPDASQEKLAVDEKAPDATENNSVSSLNFNESQVYWTKIIAILGHVFIVAGIIAFGYFHFGNFDTGVAAAVLYLLMPYSYHFQTRLDHIIPAVFLIWALVFYRRPWISGFLIGIASTLAYYPWFLIPLWVSFYWRRGVFRFVVSTLATMAIMGLTILIFSENQEICKNNLLNMVGFVGLIFQNPQGFWGDVTKEVTYRIPILAAYCGLCISLLFWPPQKNLGVLLSCSAAVLMGAQLIHPFQGGLYMAWYLPFLILTIFRPNLEDRVATTSVFESRFRIIPRAPKETNPA
ncbi:MAG: hypothetical protein IJQ39_14910 [Thermoguttaceae bacterium]|nr:hypothetical protein [Thermoguttaceae bacterium]